jgi:capsular exopolysaccharide synthesis family protein
MSRLYEALSNLEMEHRPPRGALPEPVQARELPSKVSPRWAEIEGTRSVTMQPGLASHLVAVTDSNSLGAEKFRVLAVRLDHIRKQRQFKSLQVTSSVVNEGKTLVSANLAVTLAKCACSRTLLIEGDLHRPALASLFGLRELRGLSHWWSASDQDIGCFLQRLNDMPLCFLAAGKAHDQPSDILHSERFAEAFKRLVGQFDWIVVDSPPMLPIVDVNLWSRLVDGTLLVVRAGLAPVKVLKRGLQALDHPKLVGVVLNEAAEVDQVKYEGQYYGGNRKFGVVTQDSPR